MKIKLFISVLTIAFVLGSCKKEAVSPDPLPTPAENTTLTKIKRTWQLKKIILPNGDENNVADGELMYLKDNDILLLKNGGQETNGTWSLINNNGVLRTEYLFMGQPNITEWNILKLTVTELWLKNQDNIEAHHVAI